MFKRVERLVDWWIRMGAAKEEDREVLAYGADLALYTVASTGALLLTGLLWGRWWEAAAIIACFYINQTNGGGFHADSHGKCFCTMWALSLIHIFAAMLMRIAIAWDPWAMVICAGAGKGAGRRLRPGSLHIAQITVCAVFLFPARHVGRTEKGENSMIAVIKPSAPAEQKLSLIHISRKR